MTKEMLQDIIRSLHKKNKILIISLIIVIALFIGMTIFAFSSFEITAEETTETIYENNQTANTNGDSANIVQTNTNELKDNNTTYIICGTVIVCVGLIILGVYLYGKSKSTHKTNNQKEKENND